MFRLSKENLWASLLGLVFFALFSVGLSADMRAIPPAFDNACWHAEIAVREQTSPPEESVLLSATLGESSYVEAQRPALFGRDQLSPRVGLGLTSSNNPEGWAERLGAGWYVDWTVRHRYPSQNPEHWQMVRLARGCISPSKEGIRWLAWRFPGNVWIIGNEPDNIWQDNIVPEEYAQVYHDLYYWIKESDPEALIAVAGVTQATPLRLAYLDRVLMAYEALYDQPMPVDWWTVHGFILREELYNWGAGMPSGFFQGEGVLRDAEDHGNLAYFQEQITAFRIWMAERGYRDKPLAITEYGILMPSEYGFSPEVVAQYLWDTFTWLNQASDAQLGYPADDNHLVQRWAWFSLSDPLYATSDLAYLKADRLTLAGQAFREFIWQQQP